MKTTVKKYKIYRRATFIEASSRGAVIVTPELFCEAKMHQIHFLPVLHSRPCWESLRRSPRAHGPTHPIRLGDRDALPHFDPHYSRHFLRLDLPLPLDFLLPPMSSCITLFIYTGYLYGCRINNHCSLKYF